jgi:hypothetical protein
MERLYLRITDLALVVNGLIDMININLVHFSKRNMANKHQN